MHSVDLVWIHCSVTMSCVEHQCWATMSPYWHLSLWPAFSQIPAAHRADNHVCSLLTGKGVKDAHFTKTLPRPLSKERHKTSQRTGTSYIHRLYCLRLVSVIRKTSTSTTKSLWIVVPPDHLKGHYHLIFFFHHFFLSFSMLEQHNTIHFINV